MIFKLYILWEKELISDLQASISSFSHKMYRFLLISFTHIRKISLFLVFLKFVATIRNMAHIPFDFTTLSTLRSAALYAYILFTLTFSSPICLTHNGYNSIRYLDRCISLDCNWWTYPKDKLTRGCCNTGVTNVRDILGFF